MEHLKSQVAPIRMVILDVDGVLTDGKLYYSARGETLKSFHVHDGYGIKLLGKAGIELAVISSRKSAPLDRRLDELGVRNKFLGVSNKLSVYNNLKRKFGLQDNEICYVGDDIPDLVVMKRVGFPVAVANARDEIKQVARYVTRLSGGYGAVREVVDVILQLKGAYHQLLENELDEWEKLS